MGDTAGWTDPSKYSTIQLAVINGDGRDEVLARFSNGIHVYKYAPPAGTASINGGTWTQSGTGGPFFRRRRL